MRRYIGLYTARKISDCHGMWRFYLFSSWNFDEVKMRAGCEDHHLLYLKIIALFSWIFRRYLRPRFHPKHPLVSKHPRRARTNAPLLHTVRFDETSSRLPGRYRRAKENLFYPVMMENVRKDQNCVAMIRARRKPC